MKIQLSRYTAPEFIKIILKIYKDFQTEGLTHEEIEKKIILGMDAGFEMAELLAAIIKPYVKPS